MRITDTSDLWWKTAVVYCLDVETFMDWNDDGMRRLRGPRPAARLPRRARRHLPVADAVLPDAATATTATTSPTSTASTRGWAPTATSSRSSAPRSDRGMRVIVDLVVNHTSDQHPWFRAAALSRSTRRTATSTSGATTRRRTPAKEVVFPDQENSIWELSTRRPASGTCTASTGTSPTSTSPTRRCATRSPRRWASGWSSGCPGSGWTPCRSCSRPTGIDKAEARRLARPARVPARPAGVPRPADRRRRPARRGQPAAPGPDGSSSAARTATS